MKDLLIQELPQCFKKGDQKQPLCIGIHIQVHSHYKDDDRFEPKALQDGLNRYFNGIKYLKKIIEGVPRIDIHGQQVGIVTANEAAYARDRLQLEEQRKEQQLKSVQQKTFQPVKSKTIPKPISLDELRKKGSMISQVVESPTTSKDQIKKEKQDKYAKRMARKKLSKKS